MSFLKPAFFFSLIAATLVVSAEVQAIDGRKVECKDGVCMLVEDGREATVSGEAISRPLQDKDGSSFLRSGKDSGRASPIAGAISPLGKPTRVAQGYMCAEEFIAFLEDKQVNPLGNAGLWLTLLLVLLGGLAMNLTPCVLPMIPINLMIVGRSAKRGTAYGLGMAVAYGALGVGAAVGGLVFGGIQGNPWFNAAVAVVFVALALALFGVWVVDLSRFRGGIGFSQKRKGLRFSLGEDSSSTRATQTTQTILLPFFMGALSAVLAGACVAPILISVLLLTGKLYAEGKVLALGLPFVLGLGMALPWPFLGAGLKVLPKPGAWMKQINRVFGVVVLGFAMWYGWLAWQGFVDRGSGKGSVSPLNVTTATLNSQLSTLDSKSAKPILVDCWATWCKNCAAMDRVMEDERVKKALEPYEIIRVQAEDISELRKVKGFESIRGLPAFVVFD